MSAKTKYSVTNYNGGFPSLPQTGLAGTLVLDEYDTWVLDLGFRKQARGLLRDYDLDVQELSPTSCRVTMRHIQDPGASVAFELPTTPANMINADLEPRSARIAEMRVHVAQREVHLEQRERDAAERKAQEQQRQREASERKAQEKQAEKTRRAEKAARSASFKSFGGVVFETDRGWIRDIASKQEGPVAGAQATVDSSGQLDKRVTATRLVLTGPLALGLRKTKDRRELYLTVVGDGFAFVKRVDPNRGLQARKFAAEINLAAQANNVSSDGEPGPAPAAPAQPPTPAQPPPVQAPAPAQPPAPAQTAEDVAERMRHLSRLRDEGILTEEEFTVKKQELLDRL